MAGLALIGLEGLAAPGGEAAWIGHLLWCVAGFLWAVYTVLLRLKPAIHWHSLMTALTAAAFVLFQELQLRADRTALRGAQVPRLRQALITIGVQVVRSVRRIVLHFPHAQPDAVPWARIAHASPSQTGWVRSRGISRADTQNREWSSTPVNAFAVEPSASRNPPTTSICHNSLAMPRSHRFQVWLRRRRADASITFARLRHR